VPDAAGEPGLGSEACVSCVNATEDKAINMVAIAILRIVIVSPSA